MPEHVTYMGEEAGRSRYLLRMEDGSEYPIYVQPCKGMNRETVGYRVILGGTVHETERAAIAAALGAIGRLDARSGEF